MRKFLIFAAAAFAAYTPNILVAEQVAIGASGSGSGPYVNAGLMAEVANKSQDTYKFSIQTIIISSVVFQNEIKEKAIKRFNGKYKIINLFN